MSEVPRAGRTWLAGLEERARRQLPGPIFEYVATGAREGTTTAEALSSWSRVRFWPHVLRDVTDVDLATTLLGRATDVPWAIAPSSLQRAIHPDGEPAMARAAAGAGTVVVVSSNAGTTFADIGDTGARWWVQAYLPTDRTLAIPMLERAVQSGAEAVVLTVDTPVVATKPPGAGTVIWDVIDPAILRANFDPGYEGAPGSEKATDLGPHDLDWLAERTGLPVVVKGVLRADDARRCVQAGARAIWVSNHGGRQLDRASATASALPAVVAAVGGAADVYVDGGVRCGLDVLAALALGADAVFLGRLPAWALVGGEADVARMHAELREETLEAFRLAGCRNVADCRGILTP